MCLKKFIKIHQMLLEWHSKMYKIYHVIYLATNGGGYRESLIIRLIITGV